MEREKTTFRERELIDQDQLLNQHITNNKETEHAIKDLNDSSVILRAQYACAADASATKSSELITLQKILRNMTNELQQIRQRNRQTLIGQEEKVKLIEKLKNDEIELETKLNKCMDRSMSAQDRLRNLNEFVEVCFGRIHE